MSEVPSSHPLRVLHGLMLAENLGDVHDEILLLHKHFGLPDPEGDFHGGWTAADWAIVDDALADKERADE